MPSSDLDVLRQIAERHRDFTEDEHRAFIFSMTPDKMAVWAALIRTVARDLVRECDALQELAKNANYTRAGLNGCIALVQEQAHAFDDLLEDSEWDIRQANSLDLTESEKEWLREYGH